MRTALLILWIFIREILFGVAMITFALYALALIPR